MCSVLPPYTFMVLWSGRFIFWRFGTWRGSGARLLPAQSSSKVSNLETLENRLLTSKPVSVCTSRGMMRSREMRGAVFIPFPSRKQASAAFKRVQYHLAHHFTPRVWEPPGAGRRLGRDRPRSAYPLRCFFLEVLEVYICGQHPDWFDFRAFILYEKVFNLLI